MACRKTRCLRRFGGVGLAAGAAFAALGAAGERGPMGGPLAGEGDDDAGFDAADLRRPAGSLGNAVALAEHVVLELVESVGAGGDVLLVVRAFFQPHIGDGQGQGRRRAGTIGDPLLAHVRRGVVVEGVDEDGLDAPIPQPQAPDGRVGAAIDAVGGVGVVAPRDQELGVAERILEQVVVLGVAQPPVVAVGVGRAPVPAFPAVGVVEDVGEPDHVEEAGPRSRAVAEVPPVVVGGGPGHDRLGAVIGADALHLAGDEVESFVPADPLVARLAAILLIAVAVGIEIHPLHGVEDPFVGIHAGPLHQGERRHAGFAERGVLLSIHVDGPRGSVRLVEDERPHLGDLPLLHVHSDRAAARATYKGLLCHPLSFLERLVRDLT